MKRELLTYPLTDAHLREEFAFTIEHLRESGFASCRVLFGSAWGIEYYPGQHWEEETVPLDSLLAKVAEVEGRGIGRVGEDDLYLTLSAFEFLFCNDSDIHLRFTEDAPLVEFFFTRWKRLGYNPAEWRTSDDGQKVRVRGGDSAETE